MKASGNDKKIRICSLLAVGALIVYGQVGGFDFIRYDEELYITQNAHVLSGVSYDGLLWALTTLHAGNWHPLTWLSLMLDRELYGMNAGGYHWTSVVLHLAGGLMLFLALNRMTGRLWRSGVVAGLFLIHPLHVESVAWVAERKDVLSGLFWMLSMWGYARYAEKPCVGRYLWVVLFFVLGLMSKPMVVTLPFVLLLLDWWPLVRMERGTVVRLLYEKAPLFLLSAVSSVITFIAQKEGEAVASLQNLPFSDRLGNAVVSYATYLIKMIWPFNLAIFYPLPAVRPYGQILLSGVLLVLMSIWIWLRRKSTPSSVMGWFWFLGTLVPVIGLVQIGSQAMADRYTYIPLIGLSIMAVWGSDEAFNGRRYRKIFPFAIWGVILLTLLPVSFIQTRHWRNSLTLFQHAIEVTEGNYLAHNNYGVVLMDQKNYRQVVDHFLEAIRIKPDFAEAHNNMGNIMALYGKNEEAALFYREAIRMNPNYSGAKLRFADLLQKMGKVEDAIAYYREALIRMSDDPVLHNNIAVALASAGKGREAVDHLRRALELKADYGDARKNLDIMIKATPSPVQRPDHGEDHEEKRTVMKNHFGDGIGIGRMFINAGNSTHAKLLIGIGLSILVLAGYWGVTGNDFINYDDQAYVTWNRHVQRGLSIEGIVWAFTTTFLSNWHPLTWLSLMLDRELYGMNAGGYHWTSVVLHLAGGLMLFLALNRMTGRLWRSGVVAGLFLIHPLHVESVAWVAERKDVLSGLFWMLSMWGYARYAEKPCVGRYLWVVLFFVLGLMSKPMVVTLPFVLLLLDWWPLVRMERGTVVRLLYEKAPLFLLSAVSSVITFIAQKEGEAVASLQNLPFSDRLGNAVVSYATYLIKMIWPFNLAIFYTHPGLWPVGEILFALALLLPITFFFLVRGRRSPYLPVGWLWYLGTLVPVIGLVQVGAQAMADRYTYLPLIGIFIMIVWGLAELLPDSRYRSVTSGVVIGTVMTILLCMTQIQTGYWKSSINLFSHALRVTKDNYQAHNNLARALTNEKKYQKAKDHYFAAIRICPNYMPPYLNLGQMRMEQGMWEEAVAYFSEALKIKPGDGDALLAMGNLDLKKELWDEAIVQYRMALKEKPYDSILHNNIGLALTHKGEVEPAIQAYRMAIHLDPGHAGAHNNLAMLLMGKGKNNEAIAHFRQAIGYQPDYCNAHFQLAVLLSSEGLADEASTHLREARRINPDIEKLHKKTIPEVDARQDNRVGK